MNFLICFSGYAFKKRKDTISTTLVDNYYIYLKFVIHSVQHLANNIFFSRRRKYTFYLLYILLQKILNLFSKGNLSFYTLKIEINKTCIYGRYTICSYCVRCCCSCHRHIDKNKINTIFKMQSFVSHKITSSRFK